MNSPPLIKVNEVFKSFGENSVLKGVSFEMFPRQTMVIVGPSGSGKTVLLRCLNGLETIDSGRIDLLGKTVANEKNRLPEQDLNKLRSEVGIVFQSFNLFPHLTTIQNVMVGPLKVRKIVKDEAHDFGMALLRKVGLEDKADAYPATLSGGQKQRAAIARSLAMQPKVMLFDEPTSSLDPALVEEVLLVMKNLSEEGMTMIVNTHQMNFAREVADLVGVLEDGRLARQGAPNEILL
jgi:polar amino acid transport system ATP-binding protein